MVPALLFSRKERKERKERPSDNADAAMSPGILGALAQRCSRRLIQGRGVLDRSADAVVGPGPLITIRTAVLSDVIAASASAVRPAGRIFAFFAFFA